MTIVGKGRMLALEISPKVVRAVEFVAGTRPLQVTCAAAADWPGGEPVRAGRFLREFLAEKGFTARKAIVSYFGPLIEHRIYAIPPASGETREALLRGKVAEESNTPVSELRVSGEVVGKVFERGIERQETLAVFTPEFEIRRLVFLLIEAGVTPVRVTSAPLSLVRLHPDDRPEDVVAFVHADPVRTVMAVSDGGKLRFAREFAADLAEPTDGGRAAVPDYGLLDLGGGATHPQPPTEDETDAHAEKIVTEITRSFLYYRQISRGGTIGTIYWSGVQPPEGLRKLVSERLKADLSPHPAAGFVALGEGARVDPAEFAVPIGLAVAVDDPDPVNLLPVEYLLRKARWGTYVVAAAVAVLFLAVNGVLYRGLSGAEARYRDVLAHTAAGVGVNPKVQAEFQRWRSLRRIVREASASEQLLAMPFAAWRAFFAQLAAPVPPQMTFSSLSVTRTEKGYRGEVRGAVRGNDPQSAQERLNRFLDGVRKGACLSEVRYAPVELGPRGAQGGGYVQEFRLSFALRPAGPEEGR